MDYSDLPPKEVLKQAGLSVQDFDLSIRMAWTLSEAVKMRRTEIRKNTVLPSQVQEREEKERRDNAEDERLFLGAAILLAQRMKPRNR
jgi:hypothetical protein